MPLLRALFATPNAALARIRHAAIAFTSKVGALFAVVQVGLKPVLAIGTNVYYFGFIPLVIFLGMRSNPRPKLIDLLTPM